MRKRPDCRVIKTEAQFARSLKDFSLLVEPVGEGYSARASRYGKLIAMSFRHTEAEAIRQVAQTCQRLRRVESAPIPDDTAVIRATRVTYRQADTEDHRW